VTESESRRLARFSLAVRESSLKRLRSVPEGRENWSIVPGGMSFGDLAYHLIEADRWLFDKLRDPKLDPIAGRAGVVDITERREYVELLEQLEQTGRARASMLENLSEAQLEEGITDARFGGQTSVWWVIVRGNLDHEIHHRGEIGAYLGALEWRN
jgi:uncharacterized damage-inducible protein DinB